MIAIDTNVVGYTADKIKSINEKISVDFEQVQNAINSMNRNWKGNASNVARDKFLTINATYTRNRYHVINDMVNYMNSQVCFSYDKVESSLVSAASAFK